LLSFKIFAIILGNNASYETQQQLHSQFTARIVRSSQHLVEFAVDITDTGTGVLQELPSTLQKLSFSEDAHRHGPVEPGGGDLFARVPDLKELRLSFADPEFVRGVALYCSQLVSIDLSDGAYVSDQQWSVLFTRCSLLRTVFLSDCVQLTAHTLRLLRNLHKLRLYDCNNVDDAAVQCVVSNSPALSVLRLEDCDKITLALFSEAFLDSVGSLDTLIVEKQSEIAEVDELPAQTPLQELLPRLLRFRCPRLEYVRVNIG
jgi:hypothetical protein